MAFHPATGRVLTDVQVLGAEGSHADDRNAVQAGCRYPKVDDRPQKKLSPERRPMLRVLTPTGERGGPGLARLEGCFDVCSQNMVR